MEKTIVLCVPEYRVRTDIVTRQIEDINLDVVLSVLQCQDKGGNIHFVTNERAGMSAMEVIAACREACVTCLRELNFETLTKYNLALKEYFDHQKEERKGRRLRRN